MLHLIRHRRYAAYNMRHRTCCISANSELYMKAHIYRRKKFITFLKYQVWIRHQIIQPKSYGAYNMIVEVFFGVLANDLAL